MKILFIVVCMLISTDFSFAARWGKHVNEIEVKGKVVDGPDKKLKPGDLSPDFMAVDTSGRKFSLKNLKGKYVYIDLWAMWCSPCVEQIPHLQQLERAFKKKKIAFVSISCDDDMEAWLNYLRYNKLGGVQLKFDGNPLFRGAYGVKGIPRFILLDKKGRILDSDFGMPNGVRVVQSLSELDGI